MASPLSYSFVNAANSGLTQILPAQGTGIIIRVHSVSIVVDSAVYVNFAGSLSGALTAAFPLTANGGFVWNFNKYGWFITAPNEGLLINLSTTVNAGVQISWASYGG